MTASYYTLGRSGLRVSRLALGTMTFGTESGWGSDEVTSARIFDAYLERGGNFIDTANVYSAGTSEAWLGKFIAERRARDRVVIATKFTFNGDPGNPNGGGNGRAHMVRAVEESLRRLGTDHIDLYILHCWDRITPVEEVMRTMDDLVRAGKIRHVGLSNVPGWYAGRAQTLAELRGWEPVSALQMEYSLVERSIEDEFVPMAQELGVGIMVWSPLASGLLSGKYRASLAGSDEGRLKVMDGSRHPAFDKLNERNLGIVAALAKVSEAVGRPMAQIAINWVANRPGVASVILGATRLEQLEGSLDALDFTIEAEHLAALDEASRTERRYPYNFAEPFVQARITGGVAVGGKPPSYRGETQSEA